jgi:hypothetical protein
MTARRAAAALVAGLLLGTLPLWRYAPLAVSSAPHVDHEPRHGGQLGMAGDHHIELARRAGRVEAWVSDAWRRPLEPRRAWAVFDGAARLPLRWDGDRLVAVPAPAAREVEVIAVLPDGTRVAIGFRLAAE